jgi:hypothetical protein
MEKKDYTTIGVKRLSTVFKFVPLSAFPGLVVSYEKRQGVGP